MAELQVVLKDIRSGSQTRVKEILAQEGQRRGCIKRGHRAPITHLWPNDAVPCVSEFVCECVLGVCTRVLHSNSALESQTSRETMRVCEHMPRVEGMPCEGYGSSATTRPNGIFVGP